MIGWPRRPPRRRLVLAAVTGQSGPSCGKLISERRAPPTITGNPSRRSDIICSMVPFVTQISRVADRRPIVLAEIGNRFVIRDQSAEKPDHLEIATGLTLQPPARLYPIEIAVDVELEQGRGMIGGPARYFRHNAFEPELAQIKRIDKRIYRANRIALINPFIEAFGQQSRLPTIRPNQEALHRSPPRNSRGES